MNRLIRMHTPSNKWRGQVTNLTMTNPQNGALKNTTSNKRPTRLLIWTTDTKERPWILGLPRQAGVITTLSKQDLLIGAPEMKIKGGNEDRRTTGRPAGTDGRILSINMKTLTGKPLMIENGSGKQTQLNVYWTRRWQGNVWLINVKLNEKMGLWMRTLVRPFARCEDHMTRLRDWMGTPRKPRFRLQAQRQT